MKGLIHFEGSKNRTANINKLIYDDDTALWQKVKTICREIVKKRVLKKAIKVFQSKTAIRQKKSLYKRRKYIKVNIVLLPFRWKSNVCVCVCYIPLLCIVYVTCSLCRQCVCMCYMPIKCQSPLISTTTYLLLLQ